ncbi:D-alanyl-D-alanine carboxypeptidase family protein [Pseudoroseicyclus tamaricis]|uniref:D-alanyl-D-alanine carboxypeptidase n=1 Tax=Pseudoroseicyclus tamaricis TaxID=2705421 RepID=A0A6B2JWM0_9RHOB|nr:D-alanyl-D-alanine carboxypeptidase family protein [Pseudoroseicyclus tamaricis]NDU99761.1 D-alanyl-D-alanine carboxypeptidase [Pseudoroseicyclus tamaricis]
MPLSPVRTARLGLLILFMLFAALLAPSAARSAPYAALVMDARTGEVLFEQNADTRLHPASLTKMMTLYIAFQAVQRGEISLDTEVVITSDAAAMPPSKLGLRSGQSIRLRYLIRAAAVRSANDAATAIGVALAGSQEAFARRMNATARAMGMNSTTFINMNGLTAEGHLSTARDMSVLGRHMVYDFPQYYNLFSRRTADAGIATVSNTNRRFLDSYPGADGIKTGFTNAAGYNLTASAQHGNVRIIATVFGGTSTAQRNQKVSELLDLGFSRAPGNARLNRPEPPPAVTLREGADLVATAPPGAPVVEGAAARTIRVSGIINRSLRPLARPGGPGGAGTLVASGSPDAVAEALADAIISAASAGSGPDAAAAPDGTLVVAGSALAPTELAPVEATPPPARPAELIMTAEAIEPGDVPEAEPEIVTRLSTSGGHTWGINVGRYNSRGEAERVLIRVALAETVTLEGSLRRVVQGSTGYDANFMGLTREGADLACRRLQARGTTCFMIGAES